MSTMIALFLVFAALVGCVGETGVNVKNAPPPSDVTFAVEMEKYEETVRDEDGAELAVCSYELPELRVLREDGPLWRRPARKSRRGRWPSRGPSTPASASGRPIPRPWRRAPRRTGPFATSRGWNPWLIPMI